MATDHTNDTIDAAFPGAKPIPNVRPGGTQPVLGDPRGMLADAFAPPGAAQPPTPEGVRLIYRDLPIVSIATEWDPRRIRGALRSNLIGDFYSPGMLCDEILGDDRVQATMGSRVAGLMSCEPIFEPANDSSAAREVCDSFADCWPSLGSYGSQGWMQAYYVMMGWSSAQLVWDTSGPIWRPHMRPWHPVYTYYHWTLRRYIALSQGGQVAIEPGNGKWVLHAPWGEYRAWVFGALRACAEPWLGRHYAYRDWMRFSEVHGIPIKRAKCPASASAEQRSDFEKRLLNLPSETTVLLARGLEGTNSDYDLDLLEATDTAWESFPGLIDRSDMSIVLAILFQNLTTEVTGGSFKATTSHMDIRQQGVERDDLAWTQTTYQITRPFSLINYGDADLAPRVRRDVQSSETHKQNATLAMNLAMAVNYMRISGIRLKQPRKFFGTFGIDIGKYEHVDPVQVEARLAGKTGEVETQEEPHVQVHEKV